MEWPVLVFGRAAVALIIERFTGYPQAVHRVVSHPVVWMGMLISYLDQRLNKPGVDGPEGRLRGVAALLLLIAATFLPAYMLADILERWRHGWLVEALLATTLIAQKSLRDHVLAVYDALGRSLPEARKAVSMIVGRDPSELDESGVSRAALESLAENTSDGIVAPVLWYALLGLPGIAVYKAINTADSMIGHKNEKYQYFGWASARLDDAGEPARLPAHWPALRRNSAVAVPGDRFHHAAGCAEAPIAQCGVARGSHGGGSWTALRRAPELPGGDGGPAMDGRRANHPDPR